MLKIGDKVRSKKGLFEVGEVVDVWEANTNFYACVIVPDSEEKEGIEVSGIQSKEFELLESLK
jgi:hypothetical protein